jgi:predicted branched-subunit amino acid permease
VTESERRTIRRQGFLRGVRAAMAVPGAVLTASFFGFGAFAHASGFDLTQLAFAAGIFALPGQVVLADEMAAGAGLAAIFLAVTLTAVRLLPMTVAIMPLLREDRTPLWQQLLVSHFVAVSVWVEAMRRMPELERPERIPFCFGMATVLLPSVVTAALAGHIAAGAVPPVLSAGLMFLTPIYFLLSTLAAARERIDLLAIGAGLVLGPVFFLYAPGFDLLLTGLIGGTLAFGVDRWRKS